MLLYTRQWCCASLSICGRSAAKTGINIRERWAGDGGNVPIELRVSSSTYGSCIFLRGRKTGLLLMFRTTQALPRHSAYYMHVLLLWTESPLAHYRDETLCLHHLACSYCSSCLINMHAWQMCSRDHTSVVDTLREREGFSPAFWRVLFLPGDFWDTIFIDMLSIQRKTADAIR